MEPLSVVEQVEVLIALEAEGLLSKSQSDELFRLLTAGARHSEGFARCLSMAMSANVLAETPKDCPSARVKEIAK